MFTHVVSTANDGSVSDANSPEAMLNDDIEILMSVKAVDYTNYTQCWVLHVDMEIATSLSLASKTASLLTVVGGATNASCCV